VDEDFYDAMGVDEDTTKAELKKVFRKLSLKYHPDKTQGDKNAARMFKVIRQAYDVLSDEDTREIYDAGGMDAVKEYEKTKGQTDFFGRPVSSFPQNQDTRHEKLLPLAALYEGGTVKHYVDRMRVCRGCQNWSTTRDAKRHAKCSKCQNCADEYHMENTRMSNGRIMRRKIRQKSKHMCVRDRHGFELEIERGTTDGHEITFKRQGDQNPGHLAGNVIIILKQTDHQIFRRWNDHLVSRLQV
jgi:DnaJ-class molecular chaperone